MGVAGTKATIAGRKMAWLSFFCFSSRRRHTIFDCDWSSDVCSSDLANTPVLFLSNANEQTSTERCRNLGIEYLLKKPLKRSRLNECLTVLFSEVHPTRTAPDRKSVV